MEKDVFELYSKKVGLGAQFPNDNIGTIISCALVSREDVDTALEKSPNYGDTVTGKVAFDEKYGGYKGYLMLMLQKSQLKEWSAILIFDCQANTVGNGR